MKASLLNVLTRSKTAIAYLATAVLFAIGAGLSIHHVDWWTVGGIACTAGATICHTLIPAQWLEKATQPADVSKN